MIAALVAWVVCLVHVWQHKAVAYCCKHTHKVGIHAAMPACALHAARSHVDVLLMPARSMHDCNGWLTEAQQQHVQLGSNWAGQLTSALSSWHLCSLPVSTAVTSCRAAATWPCCSSALLHASASCIAGQASTTTQSAQLRTTWALGQHQPGHVFACTSS